MPVRVLITHGMSEADLSSIRASSKAVVVEISDSKEEALEKAAGAEIIQAGYWSDELLHQASGLKWAHSGGAGVERFMTPDFMSSPVILTNSAGVYAVPMADHVLAMMLYFSRNFDHLVRSQLRREWADRGARNADELCEKTVGIIGLGGIGQEVARRAKGFGMRVLATRRHPHLPSTDTDEVRGVEALPWLLAEADYVVLCPPLTPTTRHIMGEAELHAMKPTAYLFNVGRGGLVEESALIHALQEGRIAGAGLDVFEEEPLPPSSPLWDLPNVLITPHDAGSSPHSHERFLKLFLENLRRYLAGEPLLNVVNKVIGY
jgi:phosphoglycerate dehydrogenase-like enzyme